MEASNLAQWVREEHAKVEELSDSLREHIAVVPRSNARPWLVETRKRFEHFRAHLQKHMALEEHNGYLTAVVERRPALADQVDRLKHEHSELSRLLDNIWACVQELRPEDHLLIKDCALRMERVLGYVERHEEDENLLVTYAFTQDIGTKD